MNKITTCCLLLVALLAFGLQIAQSQTTSVNSLPIPSINPQKSGAITQNRVQPPGVSPEQPQEQPKEQPSGSEAIDTNAQEPVEPKRIYQAACPAVLDGSVVASVLPPIEEGECGERSPLSITKILDIELTQTATLNCRTAETVARWLSDAQSQAQSVLGSRIARLQTSTSYQCRRRNNQLTGKISEHGFANALDIIGFELEDGKRISLLNDWGRIAVVNDAETAEAQSPEAGENQVEAQQVETPDELKPAAIFLRKVRDLACNEFTTVLGPESNPLHADHFHFDLGCHGKRCLYRICE
ncbi:MAG: extensin family protein [Pseudomonadota bacterium]